LVLLINKLIIEEIKKIFFIFIILLAVDISGVVIFYLNCISYNRDVKDLTECDAGVVFFHSFDKQNQLSDEIKKKDLIWLISVSKIIKSQT